MLELFLYLVSVLIAMKAWEMSVSGLLELKDIPFSTIMFYSFMLLSCFFMYVNIVSTVALLTIWASRKDRKNIIKATTSKYSFCSACIK